MSEQPTSRFGDSLRLLVDITRLRRGPEDLPVDRTLLAIVVVAYSALSLVFGLLPPRQTDNVFAPVLIDVSLTLVALRLLLELARKPERFLQTATATFGFQLVLAPVLLASAWLVLRYGDDVTWQLPIMLLRFAVEVWVLTVASRILRSATEWPLMLCVAAVIGLELITFLLIVGLFPQALGTATPTGA